MSVASSAKSANRIELLISGNTLWSTQSAISLICSLSISGERYFLSLSHDNNSLSSSARNTNSYSKFPSPSICPRTANPCLKRNLSDESCFKRMLRLSSCWTWFTLGKHNWNICNIFYLHAGFTMNLTCFMLVKPFFRLFPIIKSCSRKCVISFGTEGN